MSFGKEETEAVIRVMQSNVLSGYQGNFSEQFEGGEEVKALEREWSEYFHVKHAIFVNSATSGLWAACNAAGLKHDDECLVVPYSMTCSASVPLLFGARPIFVDIEPDFFCMDPDKIEEKITDKTKAMIVVNLFGQPADFDRINAIAKKHGIMVIEDAAQSIGATYKGKCAGTLSDIGVFSLNRHKPINCGEGGVICTNNDDLAFKIRLSINHSEAVVNDIERQDKLNQFDSSILSLVGQNLRGTELSAAIAREQLKKLHGIIKAQQEHAPSVVKIRPECEHSFYRYAWTRTPEDMKTPIKDILDMSLMNFKHHYITPIFKMPLFTSLGYDQHYCPVCERVDEDIILAWPREGI